MTKRILLIEDDERVASFLQRGLTAEGYFVIHAADGKQGLQLSLQGDFDLVLLDLMLPQLTGQEVCQAIRQRSDSVPIIMLTAMDENQDVVSGLRLGADDYITKPFSFEELLARIEAIMRRGRSIAKPSQLLSLGPLSYDQNHHMVSLHGKEVSLTAKELAILALLLAQPGKYFSKERILNNVWGMDMDPLTNVVDVYIGKLRKKISCEHGCIHLETKRGVGYRLIQPN